MKDGLALFSKYLPSECVNLLQKTQHWDTLYTFAKPPGYDVVNGPPAKGYNKLDLSIADVSDVDGSKTGEGIGFEVEEEGEEEKMRKGRKKKRRRTRYGTAIGECSWRK